MCGGVRDNAAVMDLEVIRDRLTALERDLDPARPAKAGLEVLAYGEISATLRLPGAQFADIVAKRMSGFPDQRAAEDYAALVRRYCEVLGAGGLSVLPTQPLIIHRAGRSPVVYLIQPLVGAETLGHRLLHRAADDELGDLVRLALEQADLAAASGGADLEVAIDAQLSNFSFTGGSATLLDVGTPFLRSNGRHLLNIRVVLAAVPPGIREVYVRQRTGEQYMDDYFERRLVAVDLLGNFIKEDAADRLGAGIAAANEWLAGSHPIAEPEVRRYYEKDAGTLELFLRVRRADRWIRTKILRQPYDFVLPGRVSR